MTKLVIVLLFSRFLFWPHWIFEVIGAHCRGILYKLDVFTTILPYLNTFFLMRAVLKVDIQLQTVCPSRGILELI